ncbi:uncharacterized protein LOC135093066 [Scylla paramamosain]|uniref:uncharacterized protein LOC135093066 n=1 Tax=Scylla paramamosain TaxID=85552 RepID=UPI003083E791
MTKASHQCFGQHQGHREGHGEGHQASPARQPQAGAGPWTCACVCVCRSVTPTEAHRDVIVVILVKCSHRRPCWSCCYLTALLFSPSGSKISLRPVPATPCRSPCSECKALYCHYPSSRGGHYYLNASSGSRDPVVCVVWRSVSSCPPLTPCCFRAGTWLVLLPPSLPVTAPPLSAS